MGNGSSILSAYVCFFCGDIFQHPVLLPTCGHSVCLACAKVCYSSTVALSRNSGKIHSSVHPNPHAHHEIHHNPHGTTAKHLPHGINPHEKVKRHSTPHEHNVSHSSLDLELSKCVELRCPVCNAINWIPEDQGVFYLQPNAALAAKCERYRNLSHHEVLHAASLSDIGEGGNDAIVSGTSIPRSASTAELNPTPTSPRHSLIMRKKGLACEHHKKLIELFCLQCDEMICGNCVPAAHNSHNVIALGDEFVALGRQALSESAKRISKHHQEVSCNLDLCDEASSAFRESFSEFEGDIIKAQNVVVDSVGSHTSSIFATVRDSYATKDAELQLLSGVLHAAHKRMESFVDRAGKAANLSSDDPFEIALAIQRLKICEKNLQELPDSWPIPPVQFYSTFFKTEQIEHAIETLCDPVIAGTISNIEFPLITCDSVSLKWSPGLPASKKLAFKVELRGPQENTYHEVYTGTDACYTLESLQHNTMYSIRICVVHSKHGNGDWYFKEVKTTLG